MRRTSAGLRILGFSGLPRVRHVRDRWFPHLDARQKRIFQGADAAAALLVGGRTVGAAAEERYDGEKHSEAFPRLAALDVLGDAGLRPDDVDLVAHSFSFDAQRDFYTGQSDYHRRLYAEALSPESNRTIAEEALGIGLADKFIPVPHHLAHAASAYAPSGFDEALVLVSDGLGERFSTSALLMDPRSTTTLLELPAHGSLGILYGVFTHYLGFVFGDAEYKVMGLAPLGDPARYADLLLENCVSLESEGRYHFPLLLANTSDEDKETHRGSLEELTRLLGPPRQPGDPIEQRHRDVAAALQVTLQTVQLHLLRHLRKVTGASKLCLAGGVALNCVANGVVLRSRLFEDLFVQPAAADDGAALGAALYASREAGETRPAVAAGTSFGPQFSPRRCRTALADHPELIARSFDADDELVDHTARLLVDGAIVGWFQGRMEFGPRALGNRSILADPRRADMRDKINALVKKREAFRPFAPAVTEEAACTLFDVEPADVHLFDHMLFVAYARAEHAHRMPATTHVDGSARLQTVSPRSSHRRFWALITRFGDLTGLPVVLNTSFNVAGQPIVRTPEQAVATFAEAGLDALVMEDTIVTRVNWQPIPVLESPERVGRG